MLTLPLYFGHGHIKLTGHCIMKDFMCCTDYKNTFIYKFEIASLNKLIINSSNLKQVVKLLSKAFVSLGSSPQHLFKGITVEWLTIYYADVC